MAKSSVLRVSALAGHSDAQSCNSNRSPGVTMCMVPDLKLFQVAAWPQTLPAVAGKAAKAVAADTSPGPGRANIGSKGAVLRVEPLKFWIFGTTAPQLSADDGTTLDLSHSRTHIRITGPDAAALLNRHLPLDLRQDSFPTGSVASTAFHHCGVTLWRSEAGFEVFLPRGFALSLWQLLVESAQQFGCEIIAA